MYNVKVYSKLVYSRNLKTGMGRRLLNSIYDFVNIKQSKCAVYTLNKPILLEKRIFNVYGKTICFIITLISHEIA